MHLLALPFLLCATFNGVHVPHDDVHGIATADLSSGVRETVITTQGVCKVFRSRDGGISWEAVHGDGLELAMADSVIWDSHPNGQRFLIGTNKGVWAYDPISEVVSALSSGLGNGDGNFIACMDAPENGSDGPILLVNREGDIFTLNRATDTWEMQLQTGNTDVRAQVSVSPHFFLSGSNGPEQSVAAAVAGVLYLSEDGGENWMTHPQFSTPAVVPGDRLITAIAYSDDYITSGDLILATSVENLSNFTGDEGTMWRSGDFGGTFSNVLRTDSSIRSLQQTPPGPSGNSWFLAAVFAYPDFYDLPSSDGILRSSDGGMTWDDFGSAQDFIAEGDASDTVTLGRQYILDFEVSPTFSTDGEIFFGRSEGLFKSRDEGLHWIPIAYRPVLHTRGMSSYVDKRGDLWAALATYGSGTLIHNVTTRTVGVWGGGGPPWTTKVRWFYLQGLIWMEWFLSAEQKDLLFGSIRT